MSAYVETGEEEIDPSISCASCEACCCRLEVMLMGDDDVPERLTVQDRWGGWVMRRLDDLWCVALDRNTMRCTIYEVRPGVCRDYQAGASECIGERSRLLVQLQNERMERASRQQGIERVVGPAQPRNPIAGRT